MLVLRKRHRFVAKVAGITFDPPAITPTFQHAGNECVIGALATLLSLDYHEVRAHAGRIIGDGLTQRQIVRLLTKLGYRSRAKRAIAWDTDCGLLTTVFPQSQHVCVLWRGVLYDPQDGRLWEDAETYLSVEQVRASVLTVLIAR